MLTSICVALVDPPSVAATVGAEGTVASKKADDSADDTPEVANKVKTTTLNLNDFPIAGEGSSVTLTPVISGCPARVED